MDGLINKMCNTHIVESYSVLKRKETLAHATLWIVFQIHFSDIILSETSQAEKDKYHMTPLHEVPK